MAKHGAIEHDRQDRAKMEKQWVIRPRGHTRRGSGAAVA